MNPDELTYHDTANLFYSGFYLEGFRQLEQSDRLHFEITPLLPKHLTEAIRSPEWSSLLFAISIFSGTINGKNRSFCIDCHDANALKMASGNYGYHLPLLQAVDHYFKVNYNSTKISETPELRKHAEKIHPIPQHLPIRPASKAGLYHRLFLPTRLQGFQGTPGYERPPMSHYHMIRQRMNHLTTLDTLEQLNQLSQTEKEIDILFVTSFRARERHLEKMRHRHQIIQGLQKQKDLRIMAGFTAHNAIPSEFSAATIRRFPLDEFLRLTSQARIVIYTRGSDDCISSKLSTCLCLGNTIIGQPLINNLEYYGKFPHLVEQFAYETPDEIITAAVKLAHNREHQKTLQTENKRFFSSQLEPSPVCHQILQLAD